LLALVAAVAIGGTAVAPFAPTRVEHAVAQSGAATIAGSADGVLLRAEPDYGAEVVATLLEGTEVGLRTDEFDTVYDPDGATRWWPVRTPAGDGWVTGFYLEIAGTDDGSAPAASSTQDAPAEVPAASDASAEEAPPTGDGENLGGTTARVADPDGVNLRSLAGTAAESLGTLPFDAVVQLRIDEADTVYVDGGRWWPVRYEGQSGWVLGSYLAPDDGTSVAAQPIPPSEAEAPAASEAEAPPAEAPASADAPGKEGPPEGPLFSVGSYVQAITDDGTGLNIRTDPAPDAERVGGLPENDVVQVMDGPFTDPTGTGWYAITDGDVTGYVTSTYLSQADQPPPPDGDDAPASDGPRLPERPTLPTLPEIELPGRATGTFIEPVGSSTFTQGFGCSPYWFEPWEPALACNFHNGIDLANVLGTPLLAADGGIVEYAGWCDCGLGYYVKIDHGNGFKTVYGHMSELWVGNGEAVRQGDEIGAMGSTGLSTGPHVHFMIQQNGVDVDPLGFL
jgi:murein DD-endopeptidase MepM/ murein hydrolase activator NlpD